VPGVGVDRGLTDAHLKINSGNPWPVPVRWQEPVGGQFQRVAGERPDDLCCRACLTGLALNTLRPGRTLYALLALNPLRAFGADRTLVTLRPLRATRTDIALRACRTRRTFRSLDALITLRSHRACRSLVALRTLRADRALNALRAFRADLTLLTLRADDPSRVSPALSLLAADERPQVTCRGVNDRLPEYNLNVLLRVTGLVPVGGDQTGGW
jgi:hypothetical protein